MANKLTLSFSGIGDAMRSPEIRAELATRADTIAGRARGLASSEKVTTEIGRADGTNAKGRPFARVTSSNAGAEWGNSNPARRNLLGRAAQGG